MLKLKVTIHYNHNLRHSVFNNLISVKQRLKCRGLYITSGALRADINIGRNVTNTLCNSYSIVKVI